mmetsp:Transcript_38094/g.107627  ORF Transcript_38094/g.107627 Transcript_38094/m.107627 type:complete len:81 (-) Transcript_38094:431-673(-)
MWEICFALFQQMAEAVEEGEDSDKAKGEKWWTRTDQAFLNEKPDKALEDEATNTQFSRYTYVPQNSVAEGAHVPDYMKAH